MQTLSLILLQESNSPAGTLITILIVFAVSAAIFLIIRSVLLWYWKINEILGNQEQQTALLNKLVEQQNRRDARVNYYKYLALGEKDKAHEQLLYIIFNDLTDTKLNPESRITLYENLKVRYTKPFADLGVEFPEYPFKPSIEES